MEDHYEGDRETWYRGHRRALRGASSTACCTRSRSRPGTTATSCSTGLARRCRQGGRAKLYLPQICGTIKWRLNNKSGGCACASTLVAAAAGDHESCATRSSCLGTSAWCCTSTLASFRTCWQHLGQLKAVVNVVGMLKMDPAREGPAPALDAHPKEQARRRQENRQLHLGGARPPPRRREFVPKARMRILLSCSRCPPAARKSICCATVNTAGVHRELSGRRTSVATLLNNLKQERQNRVCTTVAIAIVAETCSLFTVLPAERVPVPGAQCKTVCSSRCLSLEDIGEMGKTSACAVTPLLEDARWMTATRCTGRTAAATVKHLAPGVRGARVRGRRRASAQLRVAEHFRDIAARHQRGDGRRGGRAAAGAGSGVLLGYLLQGLFHPARKVRETTGRCTTTRTLGAALCPGVPGAAGRRRERVPKARARFSVTRVFCDRRERKARALPIARLRLFSARKNPHGSTRASPTRGRL